MTSPPGTAARRLRVALIADGDLDNARTNSGSARGVAQALADDPTVDLVRLVGRLPTWQRVGLAVLHVRPGRQAWRQAALKSRLTIMARSRFRDAQVRRLAIAPDVVLHHRNLYLPCRLPYACFVDTTVPLAQGGFEGWRLPTRLAAWRTRAERHYLTGALRVLTSGHSALRSAVEDVGVAPSRVEAVGAGTNPMPAAPTTVRRRPHDVAFLGLEWQRKGGDILLAAWPAVLAAVPDAVLHLVGSGPPPDSGPTASGVVSHGRIADRAALAALLAGCSVFCLPVLFDPHPLAVQEAMAAGLAVVVSDAGDLPSMVEPHGAGLVVPAGDAAALADALVKLLSDPGVCDAMGARGRAAAAEMTWSAVATRIVTALVSGLDERAEWSSSAP